MTIEIRKGDNLKSDKKIVAIGGGTGLSTLLSGLRKYTENITAIVTVSDDGGGSGKLREDLNMLPPGDIRACLLALANTQEQMDKLLRFRFANGMLKGQSFGNLFIAAMNEIYGDFGMAIKETSSVLNITGRVLPVTLDKMDLIAELENGKKFLGESAIPKFAIKEESPIKKMYLENSNVIILDDCLKAIEEADLLVLGPGSLYTSIIPNLLVKRMCEAIQSSPAKTVYICNVMTQPGETDGYGVMDHVKAILDHSSDEIIDYCIANVESLDRRVLKKYLLENSTQVIPSQEDESRLNEYKIELVKGNFIEEVNGYVRHDAEAVSKCLLNIANSKL